MKSMRKSIKMAVFAGAACACMAGAGMSVKAADKVAINEKNFAPAVMEYAQNADTNEDGSLSSKEASKVKKMRFDTRQYIDSFQGVKYFTGLKKFIYEVAEYQQDMTAAPDLDLSGMDKLEKVTIYSESMHIGTINLQNCTKLQQLALIPDSEHMIYVDGINLRGCTNLDSFICGGQTDQIDLSGLKKLEDVMFTGETETLNLDRCSGLKRMYIISDTLKTLSLKGVRKLKGITVKDPSLESLDLSKNKKLKNVNCHYTQITSLDLSGNKDLKYLHCQNNRKLTSLDVTGCTSLRYLRCHNTALTKINVKTNKKLEILGCKNTKITSLKLKKNRKLRFLNCMGTKVQKLDLSKTCIRGEGRLRCEKTVDVTYAARKK